MILGINSPFLEECWGGFLGLETVSTGVALLQKGFRSKKMKGRHPGLVRVTQKRVGCKSDLGGEWRDLNPEIGPVGKGTTSTRLKSFGRECMWFCCWEVSQAEPWRESRCVCVCVLLDVYPR